MESYLQHLLAIEAVRKAEREAGETAAHEVAQVKAKRLMAEILLEKEKGQQPCIYSCNMRKGADTFAVLAGILLFGDAEFCWALSLGKTAAEQKTDALSAADAPAEKSTINMDDKTDVKDKEDASNRDLATKAEKERAKAELEQRMKGTRKVIYSEGELPTVKLSNGGALKKPAFYVIGKDSLTWDNGNPDDPARLVQFHLRYTDEHEIDISQNSMFPQSDPGFLLGIGGPLLSTENKNNTLPQSDTIYGRYAFVGERLRLCWSIVERPYDFFDEAVVGEKILFSDIATCGRQRSTDCREGESRRCSGPSIAARSLAHHQGSGRSGR